VDRGDRHALVVQEVIDHVALHLGVGENEGAVVTELVSCARRRCQRGLYVPLRTFTEDQVKQCLALGALLGEDDLLRYVLVGAANPTDLCIL